MNKVILLVIAVFFLLGGLDYVFGNRFRIGEKFEEGIKTMGTLAIAMTGIYSLSPLLSKAMELIFVPFSKLLFVDASLFPAMFLATDMGAYQLCTSIAKNEVLGLFSAIILSSMLGCTISFTIPMAIGLIDKEDYDYFSKGIMSGIITIPVGCLVAGIIQGINIGILLWNLMPIILVSLLLALGILKIPQKLIKVFTLLGKAIISLSIVGLILQGIDAIIGVKLISGLIPVDEALAVVGRIAFVLAGAYTMISILSRVFREPFRRLGRRYGLNTPSVVGLLGCLASNLLVFATFKDMNTKGKILCTAFSVSGAFVFGGQMGFVSAKEPQVLSIFILAKLISGVSAVILANYIFTKDFTVVHNESCDTTFI
ncbi:ethanolamine utilization protein EutH [Desnuesiella massiliensis]|uniref:ethanolamine utilization protein EutH n=1 Tax=Desnuesiella massiliensis TaxID=1650662 RepID=UPI0006E145EF|nr:ethanolamine utilization protein EutH [Desnuesiella massiliensis]